MDDLVHDIVDQWEEHKAANRNITLRGLCRNHPKQYEEVAKIVSALEWTNHLQTLFMGTIHHSIPSDQNRTVGRFELIEIIGAGSFGTVWKAYDPQLQRDVALKLQNPSRAQTHDALLSEARFLSQLHHPGIVSVFEVGIENGCVFLISELSDGCNLAEFLQRQKLRYSEAIFLLEQLASALDHAHSKNVIHRDLKPSNILVDKSKRVRICDFGIGVISSETTSNTAGTWRYMSPEQKASKAIDHRSDLYSFALIAHKVLHNSNHDQESTQVIQRNYTSKTAPRTFAKGLANDPADRFPDATYFVSSIKRESRLRIVRRSCFAVGLVMLLWILFPTQYVSQKFREWTRNPNGLDIQIMQASEKPRSNHSISLKLKGNVEIIGNSSGVDQSRQFAFPPHAPGIPEAGLILDKSLLRNEVGFTVSFWYYQEQATQRSTLLHIGEASGYANATVPQLTIWLDEHQHLKASSYWRFREVSKRNPEVDTSVDIGDSSNRWRQFAVVFDQSVASLENGGTLRIYVDGDQVYQRPETRLYLVLQNKKAKLTIGTGLKDAPKSRPNAGFNGRISDLKIWDWPLSTSSIVQIQFQPNSESIQR